MHMFKKPKEHVVAPEQKAASYTESSIDSADHSPPLTSSLHPRHSASSAREQTYLRQAGLLKWARLGLSLLVAAAGAAILGCLAHVLVNYNATSNTATSHLFLSMWPANIDLRPALGTIVPAGIATLGALLYIVVAMVPSPRSRLFVQNLVFAMSSSVGAIVALFAIIYDQVITYHSDTYRDTLLTWTCNLYNGAASFVNKSDTLQMSISSTVLVPAGYKRLCTENEVGRWMMVALLVLEVVCVGVAAFGLIDEKKIATVRRERYAGIEEKSSFA